MASRLIQPGEQLARHLVPVGLVEELVAGLGIEAVCDALKTGSAIGGKELLQAFAVGADRIARTGDDIDRQLFRNTCLARRFRNLAQGIQQIDPELKRGSEAAERIGHVFVDLCRVARQPIGVRANRLKRLVEGAEGQGMDERAPAAWAQAQPLDARDDAHGDSQPGRLAVRAGEYATPESASPCSLMTCCAINEPMDEGPEIGTLLPRFQENARRSGVSGDLLPFVGNLIVDWRALYQPDITANPVSKVVESLSPRERNILERIGQGRSNKEIARELGIAPETVKSHIKNIFVKLAVEKRAQAVSRAQRLGLVGT